MARKTFKTGSAPQIPRHPAKGRTVRPAPCGERTSAAAGEPETWCGRRVSNPHDLRHGNLNPARLPVPPRPRVRYVRETATSARRALPGAPSGAPDGRPRSTPSRKRSITETPNRRRAIRDAHHRGSTARARLCTHGSGRGLYHDGARMQQQNGAIPWTAQLPRHLPRHLPRPWFPGLRRRPASCCAASSGPAAAELADQAVKISGGKPLALFSATYEGPRTLPGDAA